MKFRLPSRWSLREVFLHAIALVVAVGFVGLLGGFAPQDPMTPFQATNLLLTIAMITREALRVLENNLTFTKQVNRQLTA